ncbi:LCCL domain-containing protein [Aspergillus pseudonomiae]|uniref:LCCL domain-containing protein n=1 Tax=Aspergillus pseudonomiae TaxID=1506151 RepID=A0A5N7CSW1_9EURO|nr:LCCL domain-containing protein [Aspergillus pseudonomiae]KAE8396767.1 LCCL domain-containing protein [Aspergillus pseudonomiae]
MFGEGPEDGSRVYIPPLLDSERSDDPDASDILPEDEEQGVSYIPVWLRESSKSFKWGWVPLPIRKVARATANWVKGPDPPHDLLLKPLFPHIQELPVRYLERFFPKRKHKIALLGLFYLTWFLPWTIILLHSRSAGYIEGFGRPETLTCRTTLWEFGNECGLNGNDCRPFTSATLPFRCPANCRDAKLAAPHMVGNQTYSYQGLVVGGPQPGSDDTPVYRADSFICQAAIHAGVITNTIGGCGVVKLEGATHSFPASKQNGISSVGFPSTFPKSFSFVSLGSSQETCPNDPRWPLLGITIGALATLWLLCRSPPVLFFSTFFMVFCQVGLVSDPPTLPQFADLVSSLLANLLPASFVAFVLFRYCARPLLRPLSDATYQMTKTFLYLPPVFIGALNNYTFARLIPLERLTPHDIQQQPGAKVALAMVIPTVICIILSQAWQIRQGGLMPHYLKIYCTMGLILLILLPLPGLRLRIHHYILAILLMPGTALPTRPSLVYQGLLLGLFMNGIARWGFASIIETPAALGELAPGPGGAHGWWGSTFPNITDATVNITLPGSGSNELYHGNGNITFTLWEKERMADLGVDGISVLVNDVERWRGYLDEDKLGEFTWHRHGHNGLELLHRPTIESDQTSIDSIDTEDEDDNRPEDLFFRFAFLKGAEAGKYGGAGVWLEDGGWISPPPPKD